MKPKGLLRFAAAALSVFVFAAVGISVSAEGGSDLQTACVSASEASSGGSFTIPLKKITLAHNGSYRIVPELSGDSADITVKYKSNDKSVAKVSTKGLVVAVGAGETTIVCKGSDGTLENLDVTVAPEGEDNFPDTLYFAEESCVITVGETYHPSARIAPRGCTYTVSYSSSDESVATVDASGNITAHSCGSCTVTINTNNGLSASIEVIVTDGSVPQEPTYDYLNEEPGFGEAGYAPHYEEDSVHIAPEEKLRPELYVPEGMEVRFSSSDRSVVRVSTKGTLLGVAEGTAEVTAYCGEYYDTITVYVGDTEEEEYIYDEFGNLLPNRIEYEHSSDAVKAGNKLSPSIKIYPRGAVTNLTFYSSDENVARVSQLGNVLGVSEGTCDITAVTSNGCTATFTVTVYDELFRGIDVSKWNGDIDWATVSTNPKVNFVMIRASYGFDTKDIRLEQNVAGCEQYDIPYGFYHYMYAKNVSDALIEAEFFLQTVRPYNPTYPLVLDVEEPYYEEMSREELTDIVCAFMERIEDAGYYAMIYTSASFYEDNYDISRMKPYDTWVACWGDRDMLGRYFSHSYGMWQYSEKGYIEGIPEDVDLNYCFKDYPYLIGKYGLTGMNNTAPPDEDDDIEWYTEVLEVSD